jgi:GNAT superfamily N-acetyltransferase
MATYTLYLLPNLSHGGQPFAIVENVGVDAALRGGGYGRRLMEHARKQATAAGCYKISLTSHRNRAPAHAFYERIGFTNSHKGFTSYFDE